MNKKKKKIIFIGVSALAVMAAPRPAWAQTPAVRITCKQNIYIGHLASTGTCPGSYVIAPDGSHMENGCLVVFSPAAAGVCTVDTKFGPLTKSAAVSFTKASFKMTKGTGVVTFTNLKMLERGKTGSATKLTFNPTELAATVTLDIGGTLNFSANQAAGKYSGKLSISATLQ